MPEQYNLFGWRKDIRDERDFLYYRRAIAIPDKVDLSQFMPEVRNQGGVGSCVGFGVGTAVGSVAIAAKAFTEWESPTWIYNGARAIEGYLEYDTGCSPRDALDYLIKNGCLLEHFWPYDGTKFDPNLPTEIQKAAAVQYANFTYRRVTDGIEGLTTALADGHCCCIGGPWFYNWYSAPGGTLVPVTATDNVVGGHETSLYGYDLAAGVFFGQNSWGTDWGNKGRFTMPFSALAVFKELGGYDAHYVTYNIAPLPPPEPPPEPPTPPDPTPSKCKWGNSLVKAMNQVQAIRGRRGRFYYMNPA
jgi:hypothetical protein